MYRNIFPSCFSCIFVSLVLLVSYCASSIFWAIGRLFSGNRSISELCIFIFVIWRNNHRNSIWYLQGYKRKKKNWKTDYLLMGHTVSFLGIRSCNMGDFLQQLRRNKKLCTYWISGRILFVWKAPWEDSIRTVSFVIQEYQQFFYENRQYPGPALKDGLFICKKLLLQLDTYIGEEKNQIKKSMRIAETSNIWLKKVL